jgi:hypothetical protein
MGPWPAVAYVNDASTAISAAKRAAGDENVVHGAATARAAGVSDELKHPVVV